MIRTVLLIPLIFVSTLLFGQDDQSALFDSNKRTQVFNASQDTVRIDSLSIISSTFQIFDSNGAKLSNTDYYLDALKSRLFVDPSRFPNSLNLDYFVFSKDFSKPVFRKDTAIIQANLGVEDPFKYRVQKENTLDIFKSSTLQRNGSVSRGLVVGNRQNLSVNSDFNLQLSGKLTDKVNMLANISDSNIPIQAEGNTQQLQDFDNIFIKLFTEEAALVAGDFRMDFESGRFLRFAKKARGLDFSYKKELSSDTDSIKTLAVKTSLAVSKGKFSRNIFFGVEGNQGPYQMRGAENELFVIVLSGTERVYSDGILLTRGEDQDYVIDYNAAEIVFTANYLVTKDRMITVEFQYSDKNYARTALNVGAALEKDNSTWSFNFYNEQDSKNQPLQQDLSPLEKQLLSDVGDDVNRAVISSIDSVSFNNAEVLYLLIDSLGYDSVFVHQEGSDSAFIRLNFTNFGPNQGDYVQDGFTPNGRKFKWVAPDTIAGQIVPQGDYRPVRKLITPQKRQMLTARYDGRITKSSNVHLEGSLSNRDQNSFSSIDDGDNIGFALFGGFDQKIKVNPKLDIVLSGNHEWKEKQFTTIERYRLVEFNTDWNYQGSDLINDEHISNIGLSLRDKKTNFLRYELNSFLADDAYQGLKNDLRSNWDFGKYHVKTMVSLLSSDGDLETEYFRHTLDFYRNFKKFRVGIKDDIESNKFFSAEKDSLLGRSFAYIDFEYYIGNVDTAKNSYRAYFRDRIDKKSDNVALKDANKSKEYGVKYKGKISGNHFLELTAAQRRLEIIDSTLVGLQNIKAEDSFLAKIYYRGSALNRGLVFSTLYDISSGLERKREFIYLEVPVGQGVYVWVDYNENNVKELQEFEIAKFQYEANYIRTFTLTNDFQKTFGNSFGQNLELKPEYWWKDSTGFLQFLSRFSNINSISIARKTLREEESTALNPFLSEIDNAALISLNSSIRSVVFFNKRNQKWGANFSYSEIANKSLLSNGFEARDNNSKSLSVNWNINKELRLEQSVEDGNRESNADYSSTRDYNINFQKLNTSFQYQPNNNYRITFNGAYNDKRNQSETEDDVNATALVQSLGLEGRYSAAGKGNIQAGFSIININYEGPANNSLSFEMLDGLATGTNLTWNLLLQQSLMKNLELTINYNARKSEEESVIHTGGMQLRAVF